MYIGIDTSCYTTSVACIDSGSIVLDERTVLSVPLGSRGLRQSEILFQHNRNLPQLIDRVFAAIPAGSIQGIGVSEKPCAEKGSYMPSFLAGIACARSMAAIAGVPLFPGNHQLGHFRAALFGNEELFGTGEMLGMHISGGTTDLVLLHTVESRIESIRKIGAGADLHAGQLVDRIGVALGLGFPSGKHLEHLAECAIRKHLRIPSSVRDLNCSFSGAETGLLNRIAAGETPEEIAYGVYDCLSRTFSKMLLNAAERTGCKDALLAGGVASSLLLREMLTERTDGKIRLRFGKPELSADNAVGIALTAEDELWTHR